MDVEIPQLTNINTNIINTHDTANQAVFLFGDAMAIRIRLKVDATPILNEIATIDAFNDMVKQAADETRDIIAPHFLDEATHYPPAAKLPFEFNTERSRRWYFAAVNGRIPGVTIPTSGGRYRRTGKLKNSFFVKVFLRDGSFEIVLGSDSDKTKWVVGSFDRNRNYQVRGHRNTGWQLIAPTADFWLDAAEDEFLKRIPVIYANYDVTRQNR